MKKVLKVVLFLLGWVMAITLLFDPPTLIRYRYVDRIDTEKPFEVELKGAESMMMDRMEEGARWVSGHEVTMEQFSLYQLNHPEEMYFLEDANGCTNCPSYRIATSMSLGDAEGFCKWLTWRLKMQGNLPVDGYEFQVDPWVHKEYIPQGDWFYLPDGFRIILQQRLYEEIPPPLFQWFIDLGELIARFNRLHAEKIHSIGFAFKYIALPGGIILWIRSLYKRGMSKNKQPNDET